MRKWRICGLSTPADHFPVSAMAPNDLFYVNTEGTFGVVYAGHNWGRIASAAHRRALSLGGAKKSPLLLRPEDALVSAENDVHGETILAAILFVAITGYHLARNSTGRDAI